ncbi:hypothetical protein AVEN_201681-1 [Araneus ventricosus]|uniref:Uncharacterized protein n=1 Tax=Araneus ventricosus TaxID=182803 RepID=A0A4Y2F6G0_ARAVE|nr:hypothetical protein AVEN_201681-1 [Araneus ventricosus]
MDLSEAEQQHRYGLSTDVRMEFFYSLKTSEILHLKILEQELDKKNMLLSSLSNTKWTSEAVQQQRDGLSTGVTEDNGLFLLTEHLEIYISSLLSKNWMRAYVSPSLSALAY